MKIKGFIGSIGDIYAGQDRLTAGEWAVGRELAARFAGRAKGVTFADIVGPVRKELEARRPAHAPVYRLSDSKAGQLRRAWETFGDAVAAGELEVHWSPATLEQLAGSDVRNGLPVSEALADMERRSATHNQRGSRNGSEGKPDTPWAAALKRLSEVAESTGMGRAELLDLLLDGFEPESN